MPKNTKNSEEIKDSSTSIPRISTHISNLDEILGGGLPKGTITIIAGPPGTGKTTLSQQILISNATPDQRVLFFQTLSEPTAKTLKYLKQFKFFDPAKLANGSVEFIDLGGILKIKGVQEGIELLMGHVKRVKPAFVVIDSFKVFEDLAHSREELRKLSYEVAVNLMAWEYTTLLLGEFNAQDLETNPLVSIVDGLIRLNVRKESGEQQRFIQVVKMRGTDHSREEHTMAITADGVGVYAPRATIRREFEGHKNATNTAGPVRAKLGISKIDELLGEGVPAGSSFLISGVAGTGKTLLSLEFIYRGAKEYGEKGIYFSFEETEERLRAEARGMGWELDKLIESGMVEIVFIAQPDIVIEKHLLMMNDRIAKLDPKRIAIDSVSLFVHKIDDQQIVREKIFQLATIVQKAQAVGFFITDVPYGSSKLSRFGVEETVVDGVILLTASEKEFDRERFIEIYKIRNTAHLDGRHKMEITSDGIFITPRQIDRHHKVERSTPSELGAINVKQPGGEIARKEEVSPAGDSIRYQ
jgi:circadian clock protein KaiC